MARNMTTPAKGRTTKAGRVAGAPAMRLSGCSRHAGLDFAVSVDPVVLKALSTQLASTGLASTLPGPKRAVSQVASPS